MRCLLPLAAITANIYLFFGIFSMASHDCKWIKSDFVHLNLNMLQGNFFISFDFLFLSDPPYLVHMNSKWIDSQLYTQLWIHDRFFSLSSFFSWAADKWEKRKSTTKIQKEPIEKQEEKCEKIGRKIKEGKKITQEKDKIKFKQKKKLI